MCSVWSVLHAFSVWPATASDLISPRRLDPHSKAERDAIARDLDSRVSRFLDLFADLSPKEIEKLEQDEAKIAAAPVGDKSTIELQLSVAYQHRQLIRLFTEIHEALACVVRIERDVDEMLCWARPPQRPTERLLALQFLRQVRLAPVRNIPTAEHTRERSGNRQASRICRISSNSPLPRIGNIEHLFVNRAEYHATARRM